MSNKRPATASCVPTTTTKRHGVKVSCRFRPSTSDRALDLVIDADTVRIGTSSDSNNYHHATFDHIYGPETTQTEIFNHIGLRSVQDVLQGYNCTILTYGQTGSGKTHTVVGSTESPGLLPQAVECLLNKRTEWSKANPNGSCKISMSCFEIYQEKIRDLLAGKSKSLRLREDKVRGIWIEGGTEIVIEGTDHAFKDMKKALSNRVTASHQMNDVSSRSHCIVLLTVVIRTANTQTKQTGNLYIVDLAGSETVRKTRVAGKQLNEARHINKSLTALGMVINALTEGHSKHIPYRNSKLTRLLSNSLGGNAKTQLILTCSSSSINVEETISTLRFGARAMRVQNTPVVNTVKGISEYKQLLSTMERKVSFLSKCIENMKSSQSVCSKCSRPEDSNELAVLPSNDVEKESSEILCVACKLGTEKSPLFICDGNCGNYWHPACANLDSEPTTGEWYCTDCRKSLEKDNPTTDVIADEIQQLQNSLKEMKGERDFLEMQNSMDKAFFESTDAKKNDLHKSLQRTIANQEQEISQLKYSVETSFNELQQERRKGENARNRYDCLYREHVVLRQTFEEDMKAKDAECEILRRSLESTQAGKVQLEAQVKSLSRQLEEGESRAVADRLMLKEYQVSLREKKIELGKLKLKQNQDGDDDVRGKNLKLLRPLTSTTGGGRKRMDEVLPRANIQEWWSGQDEDGESGGPKERFPKLMTGGTSTTKKNNISINRPFKARLVGLLASLEEEAEAFKDLGEKISKENTLREKELLSPVYRR